MTESIESMYIEAAGDVESKKIAKSEENKVFELEHAKLVTIKDSLMSLIDKKENEARVSIRENYASLGKIIKEEDIEKIIIEKRPELIKALIPEDENCIHNIKDQLEYKESKTTFWLVCLFLGVASIVFTSGICFSKNLSDIQKSLFLIFSFLIGIGSVFSPIISYGLFGKRRDHNKFDILFHNCRCDRCLVDWGYRLREKESLEKQEDSKKA